jgi:hypothetical protein
MSQQTSLQKNIFPNIFQDEKERDTEPVMEGHDCIPKHP